MKQDHKVVREKNSCPKFCKCAYLKFQAQYRVECHLHYQIDISEQASTNFLIIFFI